MSYEDLKEATKGFYIRPLIEEEEAPVVTPAQVPMGMFNPLIMPTNDLGAHENSLVHLVDPIPDDKEPIDRANLAAKYKEASKAKDWSKLPEPFGFKGSVGPEVKLQISLIPMQNCITYIYKHAYFPNKYHPMTFKRLSTCEG